MVEIGTSRVVSDTALKRCDILLSLVRQLMVKSRAELCYRKVVGYYGVKVKIDAWSDNEVPKVCVQWHRHILRISGEPLTLTIKGSPPHNMDMVYTYYRRPWVRNFIIRFLSTSCMIFLT